MQFSLHPTQRRIRMLAQDAQKPIGTSVRFPLSKSLRQIHSPQVFDTPPTCYKICEFPKGKNPLKVNMI